MRKINFYHLENGDCPVQDYLDTLSNNIGTTGNYRIKQMAEKETLSNLSINLRRQAGETKMLEAKPTKTQRSPFDYPLKLRRI
jgi:hypothetical protein